MRKTHYGQHSDVKVIVVSRGRESGDGPLSGLVLRRIEIDRSVIRLDRLSQRKIQADDVADGSVSLS